MEAVERDVTLPTEVDDAWVLISDPDELATWLGSDVDLTPEVGAGGTVVDDDGTRRRLLVDDVVPGERIAWHWWADDDTGGDGVVSRVEITIAPVDHGTRVRVVEQPVTPPVALARVGGRSTATGAKAAASCIAGRAELWAHRLLHLELRALVAVAALV